MSEKQDTSGQLIGLAGLHLATLGGLHFPLGLT
jgi:hypothetical protein